VWAQAACGGEGELGDATGKSPRGDEEEELFDYDEERDGVGEVVVSDEDMGQRSDPRKAKGAGGYGGYDGTGATAR